MTVTPARGSLCSRSPSAAKRLGASVKNFNTQDCDNVKEEIMLEILRIKFAPNTDLTAKLTATAQKTIAIVQKFVGKLPMKLCEELL